jgi:hypothetical protein
MPAGASSSEHRERRDAVIRGLIAMHVAAHGSIAEEAGGSQSATDPRLIQFINTRLREMGETWTYPERPS